MVQAVRQLFPPLLPSSTSSLDTLARPVALVSRIARHGDNKRLLTVTTALGDFMSVPRRAAKGRSLHDSMKQRSDEREPRARRHQL